MASPALSQASTAFESDAPQLQDHEKPQRRAIQHVKEVATSQDILLFLVAFRILNALCIRTFFQPDEYFQSLEPAWEIAFGSNSGAWITWEWKNQLRSAIHPTLFAGVYWVSAELSKLFQFTPHTHAELLLAAPKVTQAVIAASADYYTWKLGERMYGRGSNEAWAALFLTVVSPWQWFVSTRTLSNCLETALTVIALHQWPWHWSLHATGDEETDKYGLREESKPDRVKELAKCVSGDDENMGRTHSTAYRLCRCLLLAAVACILRPTNILIWICLASFSLWKSSSSGRIIKLPWVHGGLWVNITSIAHGPASKRERMVLVLETIVCGTIVLVASATIDRLYYQQWTFPPLRFLYFNLAQSLSVHYGRNDWHYYLTQGYPLLLTTFLPFAVVGLYQSLFPQDSSPTQGLLTANIKRQLATTSILVPFILSFISHKEVRFIYPLLPPLHLLSAAPFTSYFFSTPSRHTTRKRLLLTLILTINLLIAIFTTTLYQQAPLTTLAYLRSRITTSNTTNTTPITVAFLTPCHSTPWRSHLIHPSLKAWALTCEPPLHLPPSQHSTYLDEADLFYASPTHFLTLHLGRPPKNMKEQQVRLSALETATGVAWDGKGVYIDEKGREREQKKAWTGYIVAFGQLEGELGAYLRGSGYGVCWRGWNGWGHEDWRRRRGMVVWCLDEGEKRAWKPVEEEKERGKRMGWRGIARRWW
ncbi:MAG: hypothetical protein Q9169_002918 [Polycauliona sp. 2 TL-2023]